MDRRKFCKLLGLAAAATATTGAIAAVAAPPALRRCRVTVLRRNCFLDIQSRYLDEPETGLCSRFCEGQVFDVTDAARAPEGFCPTAWACIKRHVESVLDGTETTQCGLSREADNSVIACCNDGTRPVVFKISKL